MYVREVARSVMKTQGFTRNDTGTYEMQAAIMHAQLQAEVEVLRHAGAVANDVVLLSDRSAIDPIVYASTAKTVAEGTRSRLLLDQDFQAVLPVYRRSLFGKFQYTVKGVKAYLFLPSRAASSQRMDRGRWRPLVGRPVYILEGIVWVAS